MSSLHHFVISGSNLFGKSIIFLDYAMFCNTFLKTCLSLFKGVCNDQIKILHHYLQASLNRYEVITWYAMIKGTSSNDQIKLLHHYLQVSLML